VSSRPSSLKTKLKEKFNMQKKTRFITQSAIIAVLYIALTLVSNAFGLASGVIQVRLSETLTILPMFMPSAIPGLFIGCLIANFMCGSLLLDVIFGSIATLLGALGTYYFGKNKWIAPVFPIISNTVIVPFVLKYVYGIPGAIWYFVLTVFIGELISCGILGILLHDTLKKTKSIDK